MTQTKEIEALRRKARAIEDRLRSFENRIREIEQSFSAPTVVAFVDPDSCAGCGTCLNVCPAGAISVEEIAQVDPTRCTGCGSCIEQCPNGTLALRSVRKSGRARTLRSMGRGRASNHRLKDVQEKQIG